MIKGKEKNEYYREYKKNIELGKHIPKTTKKTGITAYTRKDYQSQYYQYIRKIKNKKEATEYGQIKKNEQQPVIKSIEYGKCQIEL